MKKFYEIEICGLKRELELFPVSDSLKIAAFIMFGDVEMTVKCAEKLLELAPEYDIMITSECKSLPLVYEMAKQAGDDNYIIARKSSKIYMRNIINSGVDSITTANHQILCIGESEINAMKGRRVLIVDDVISTGSSIESLEELVTKAGGEIVGKMAVLAEGDAATRDDIIFIEKLPLFDAEGNVIS